MTLRITMVGGGSTHWTPTLLVDFANSPVLCDAEVTLVDTATTSLPPMVELAAHLAKVKGIGLRARAADGLAEGLEGADVVLTTLSVGGFESMACDIEIPYRYGIRQPVGDTVGPGGIFRSLRSVPVMVDIAHEVARHAPDALLVNVSNPLTSLCRAVSRETPVRVVGLCNELVGLQFTLSLLFDVGFDRIEPVVGGVNHLPLVTGLTIDGRDGFEMLRDAIDHPDELADQPIWMDPPAAMHWHRRPGHDKWTKADVVANCRLKLELFRRFGVLPGSADTHVSEFFSWFLTSRSDFGRDWGVHHYGIPGHMADKDADNANVAELLAASEVPPWSSGELVAALLEGVAGGRPHTLPVNLPNRGQVTNLPEGVVVECMGVADADGVRPRHTTEVPGLLGHHLEQVVASQELTVDAALRGDRTTVLAAMCCDPLASALPYEDVVAMTEELLAATARWLPRFAA